MNTANPASHASVDQFQALQELIRAGDASGAATATANLRNAPLTAQQRALVLELQGDLRQSLELRFAPHLALQRLEESLVAQEQQPWLHWIRQLIESGYQRALLRTLASVLQRYPLDQQRRELLETLEQDPALSPLAQQLKRLVGQV